MAFRELLDTKFEPFTRRFPAFKRVSRGLKIKVFDLTKFNINKID